MFMPRICRACSYRPDEDQKTLRGCFRRTIPFPGTSVHRGPADGNDLPEFARLLLSALVPECDVVQAAPNGPRLVQNQPAEPTLGTGVSLVSSYGGAFCIEKGRGRHFPYLLLILME
jgi:hypothetical protein